jgi:hypothetical protein
MMKTQVTMEITRYASGDVSRTRGEASSKTEKCNIRIQWIDEALGKSRTEQQKFE